MIELKQKLDFLENIKNSNTQKFSQYKSELDNLNTENKGLLWKRKIGLFQAQKI